VQQRTVQMHYTTLSSGLGKENPRVAGGLQRNISRRGLVKADSSQACLCSGNRANLYDRLLDVARLEEVESESATGAMQLTMPAKLAAASPVQPMLIALPWGDRARPGFATGCHHRGGWGRSNEKGQHTRGAGPSRADFSLVPA
jgi:hypothetical protein